MGARRSGGTSARLKAANQARAAYMKAHNITRNTARCPVCHALIGIAAVYNHLATGKCHTTKQSRR